MAFRSKRTEVVVATLLLAALAVGMLLWLYYPIAPQSVVGWIMLFVIGLPTWLFLERLGERVFGPRLFSSLSSKARIAIAAPTLILLMIVAGYAILLGQRAIAGS